MMINCAISSPAIPLIHVGKVGGNTLDIAKRGTLVTRRKGEYGTYTVTGSRVQLWGLKIQLNCCNIYIMFTGSIIPISFRASYYNRLIFLESQDSRQLASDQDVHRVSPDNHHKGGGWSNSKTPISPHSDLRLVQRSDSGEITFRASDASTVKHIRWTLCLILVPWTAIVLWISASFHINTATRWDNRKQLPSSQGTGLTIFLKQRGRPPDSYKRFSGQMSRKSVSFAVFLSQQLCIKVLPCTGTQALWVHLYRWENGLVGNTEPQVSMWYKKICHLLLPWRRSGTGAEIHLVRS